jgi:hypothetical protein
MTTLLPAEPPPDIEDEDIEEALEFLRAFKPKSDWMKECIKRRIAALEEKLK